MTSDFPSLASAKASGVTDAALARLARELGERMRAAGLQLSTAESCTGGWIAKVVTDIAGSSAWLERGFVTYTNQAKQEMLGVRAETLAAFGAVSEPVVREMALGALANSPAHLALAVSGIAGPGGGSPDKPVGTVCLGWAMRGREAMSCRLYFAGDRDAVRRQSVARALTGLLDWLQEND
jgi:nicotinamide-nucleotide amidase